MNANEKSFPVIITLSVLFATVKNDVLGATGYSYQKLLNDIEMKRIIYFCVLLMFAHNARGQNFDINVVIKNAQAGDQNAIIVLYENTNNWGLPGKWFDFAKQKAKEIGYLPAIISPIDPSESEVKMVRQRAAAGDCYAYHMLADIDFFENFDYSRAEYRRNLEKAAELGCAKAQLFIAENYKDADRPNYSKAAYWYQKAAEQGNASAMEELGMLYLEGKGVKQDVEKFVEWTVMAANMLSEDAMENLGDCYLAQKNSQMAIYWYKMKMDLRWAKSDYFDEDVAKKLKKLGINYHPKDNPDNAFLKCRYNPSLFNRQ